MNHTFKTPADGTTFGPSVIQPRRVIANAWTVARFGSRSLPADCPDAWQPVRQRYLQALNQVQNHPFPDAMIGDDLTLDFGESPETEVTLRELLAADPLPEGWQYSRSKQGEIRRYAHKAIQSIAALDPALHRGMRVIVAGFIFARRPNLEGGSISALMGPIWLGPSSEWTTSTYIENMIHEYVHQCLFLDEMVRTIFTKYSVEEMSTPDALVTSTILKRRRPYDKSYHSAFVAHVLAQYYLTRGEHEKARSYLESTRLTIDELLDKAQFASVNGLAILRELSAEVDMHLELTA